MNKRLIVIGLTGGIGMGKSTVASQLKALGARICSADAIVHRLMDKEGKAVNDIKRHFPGVIKQGAVDRKSLGDIVFQDKKKLTLLENILHPLVIEEENAFIAKERRRGTKIVVLEIPLLFETKGEKRCDKVIVVSAPYFLQKQRVMRRKNMTEQKLRTIIRSQMPEKEKRQRADYIVPTGLGKGYSFRKNIVILRSIYEA